MSSEIMIWDQCREWAEAAAGDFLLLDPGDLPAMAHFLRRMEQQAARMAEIPESSGRIPELSQALSQAAERWKAVILETEPDPSGAMADVAQVIELIQTTAQKAEGGDPAPLDPEQESVPGGSGASEANGPADAEPTGPPAWVDDSIVSAYVEQQIGVLPEMEQVILAFEKKREPELISNLRRMIHTLKGESGVVGALPIEKVCHRLEDVLEGPIEDIPSDLLLAALDWIGRAVQTFGAGEALELDDTLFQRLAAPLDAAAPAPVPESPPGAECAASTPPPSGNDTPPMDSATPIADRDLALDFAAEAQEHFETADENLLILEREPENADAIGAVFRAFHTIKGVAGFLGLPPIGDLAHAAETLLDDVRKGKRIFGGVVVEVTFDAFDALKNLVSDLREAAAAGRGLPVRPEQATVMAALHSILAGETVESTTSAPAPSGPAPEPDALPKAREDTPEQGQTPPDRSATEPPKAVAGGSQSAPEAAQTMKVDAVRIDLLLDTIGELVIAEAIVSGDPDIRKLKSVRVEKSLALLGKITRTLQDMGMSMRLVPIDPVFRKMARLVRDLAKKSGKKVDLAIEGGDTEIDKSMVEKLGDPLVHMIRNSMDHGLEPGDERQAQGKSETGHIVLRAHHQGGNIHIDIEDDGRGLNREAILAKAIERGLISSGEGMSDQDIFAMIFQAGFSTAKQVTEISGRGVGMDVVRRNIEALRGNVLIRSTPGKGSVFTLALPLTTAIIDGMLARIGEETYIFPTLSILESFRPAPGLVHSVSGKGEVVSFRGNLLPLFRLSRLLGVTGGNDDPLRAIVMVVEEFGKHWGFMVDNILGQQQVVIKSLGEGMGSVPGLAGASILADGRPGLIIDVGGVIRLATERTAGGGRVR